MKIALIPTRVYEANDRVQTCKGKGIVIYDELEGLSTPQGVSEGDPILESVFTIAQSRNAVFVRLEDAKAMGGQQELPFNRNDLVPLI